MRFRHGFCLFPILILQVAVHFLPELTSFGHDLRGLPFGIVSSQLGVGLLVEEGVGVGGSFGLGRFDRLAV